MTRTLMASGTEQAHRTRLVISTVNCVWASAIWGQKQTTADGRHFTCHDR